MAEIERKNNLRKRPLAFIDANLKILDTMRLVKCLLSCGGTKLKKNACYVQIS